MNKLYLSGPTVRPAGQIGTCTNPHELRCDEAANYKECDAYVVYKHARDNWLVVLKYAASQAVSSEHLSSNDEYYGNVIYTFRDGSQLVFAS